MGSSMAFGQAWNYFTAATTALAAETFKAAAACFGADAARPLPRPYAAGSPPSFCGAVVIKKRYEHSEALQCSNRMVTT